MVNKGIVKWFNDAKGYGFLREDGQEQDIFVHYSSIEGEGFKTLEPGEEVEFHLTQGPKGLKADKVMRKAAE